MFSSESSTTTGMAEMPGATAPLCGEAHGETPEMAGMAGTGEMLETLETFGVETCVMQETTGTHGTCETHGISGIQGT